jgi:hypothetical protein
VPLPSDIDQLTIRARRSLRASHERRGAVLRRRRVLRGRRAAIAVAGVFAISAGGALAAPGNTATLSHSVVKTAQRALDVHADGVVGPKTKRAIRSFQRKRGLVVDGILGPATLRALRVTSSGTGPGAGTGRGAGGLTPDAQDDAVQTPTDVPAAPNGEAASTLARIAQCESGGDPTAVSPDGRYRGKYQFDVSTWAHMGGTGDPAAAPEAEQDARAGQLLARRGTAPWPACG